MKKTVLKIGRMVAIASSCFLFGFVDASAQKILRKSENMRPVWLVSKTPETTNETFHYQLVEAENESLEKARHDCLLALSRYIGQAWKISGEAETDIRMEQKNGAYTESPKVISENQEKVTPTMPEQENEPASKEIVNYYDRSRSSISLLGCFNVRDKEGNDITANFTPRLKHLLILLILYTEKNPNGILTSKTTGILWPDKEETAARNNRNVNLRKLRVLLESIGDVEVVTENNFMHIKWGENVFCDYREVLARIQQFKEKENDELLNRILELLLYGPLLPNTILDWLDDFKETYSSHSIDLLKDLFEIEKQRNHPDMILRLADIMFLHDPLNEEALAAKCAVFSAQGKKGIARNLYDRFCKEYRDSMGEDYKTPFADL